MDPILSVGGDSGGHHRYVSFQTSRSLSVLPGREERLRRLRRFPSIATSNRGRGDGLGKVVDSETDQWVSSCLSGRNITDKRTGQDPYHVSLTELYPLWTSS